MKRVSTVDLLNSVTFCIDFYMILSYQIVLQFVKNRASLISFIKHCLTA